MIRFSRLVLDAIVHSCGSFAGTLPRTATVAIELVFGLVAEVSGESSSTAESVADFRGFGKGRLDHSLD